MTDENYATKEKILKKALPLAAIEGWTQGILIHATEDAGYERDMAIALFPEGVSDLAAFFSGWADQQMMNEIAKIDPEDLKIRARAAKAAMARFRALDPYRDAVKEAAKYWAIPYHSIRAKQLIWSTADKIWEWAGDTSTDYNRYTKRGLLSIVLASTAIYWLAQNDSDMEQVEQFLKKRIENVLKVGQAASKFKDFKDLASFLPFKNPFSKTGAMD